MTVMALTPLLNQYLGPTLKKHAGTQGKTVLTDALSGAMMGMYLVPEGAAAGALLGAAYGDRGHIARQLEVGGHDLVHGLDSARHQLSHLGDNVASFFGFGGSPAPAPTHRTHLSALPAEHGSWAEGHGGMTRLLGGGQAQNTALGRSAIIIHNHVTVKIGEKELKAAVVKQIKATAARMS